MKTVTILKTRMTEKLDLNPTTIFLPRHLDQVRAIAMRGLTDEEIAEQFCVPKKLFEKWKTFYPSFRRAIEEGRTEADVAVIQSLYKRAVGTKIKKKTVEEKIVRGKKQRLVNSRIEELPGDVEAAKFWLTNRDREHWKNRRNEELETRNLHLHVVRREMIDEVFNELLTNPGLIEKKQ